MDQSNQPHIWCLSMVGWPWVRCALYSEQGWCLVVPVQYSRAWKWCHKGKDGPYLGFQLMQHGAKGLHHDMVPMCPASAPIQQNMQPTRYMIGNIATADQKNILLATLNQQQIPRVQHTPSNLSYHQHIPPTPYTNWNYILLLLYTSGTIYHQHNILLAQYTTGTIHYWHNISGAQYTTGTI